MTVNTSNARPGEYSKIIGEIANEGVCPFCQPHLSRIHPNQLHERRFWLITDNAHPYEPKKYHFLIIHKNHVENLEGVSREAEKELFDIIRGLCVDNKIEGSSLIFRIGDTRYTGASVVHLHAHLFQSNPDDPQYNAEKGVLTRVG